MVKIRTLRTFCVFLIIDLIIKIINLTYFDESRKILNVQLYLDAFNEQPTNMAKARDAGKSIKLINAINSVSHQI